MCSVLIIPFDADAWSRKRHATNRAQSFVATFSLSTSHLTSILYQACVRLSEVRQVDWCSAWAVCSVRLHVGHVCWTPRGVKFQGRAGGRLAEAKEPSQWIRFFSILQWSLVLLILNGVFDGFFCWIILIALPGSFPTFPRAEQLACSCCHSWEHSAFASLMVPAVAMVVFKVIRLKVIQ